MPSFTHAHHVGLTVRDRWLSAEWYQRVLGFRFVREFGTGIPRVLLLHPDSGFLVGLYNIPAAPQSASRRGGSDSTTLPWR